MALQDIPSRGADRLRAAVIAACVTAVAFCLGDVVARQYPFGPRTRDVNDLGNQFVPFHAHLWDLLHGRADGGWLLNWQSGYGSSFLPDFGTYLSSPFAPLVAVFPRDQIDLAVYVITVLKIVSAAAAMACLLLTLRPGPRWAAGVLGASYALCGWTLMLASYNPMWLDGLIAFPVLCMVGEWAREGRRQIWGIVIVALCWTANFYIAYMATIGAALVLVARLVTDQDPRTTTRVRLLTLVRAAVTTVLGVGLTAPLLLTIVKGTKLAYPLHHAVFHPLPWTDLLVRLLPGTYGFSSPSTYVDTAALLLAFVLPFHSAVPRRTRVVWTVMAIAIAASFQWRPTHLMWHAFTTPNGSPYRQTFVLSGVLVIAAWLALSHALPSPRQLACGAGVMAVVAGIAALGAPGSLAGLGTYPMLGVGLVAAVGALSVLRRAADSLEGPARRTVPAAIAIGVLVVAQVGQIALSNAWIDRKRVAAMDDYAVWGQRQDWQRETIASADDWPDRRTDPGREQTVGNDPMAVGGQGAQYYSSLTADVYTRTMLALGDGWTSHGRNLQSLDNPVTDVIFSVGARLRSPRDPHTSHIPQTAPPSVVHEDVPPLVTVRTAAPPARFVRSPYRNQELLLGSGVYTAGRIALTDGSGKPVPLSAGGVYRTPGGKAGGKGRDYRIATSCPARTDVYFWAPNFMGDVGMDGQQQLIWRGALPSHRAPMQRLGPTPEGGRLFVLLHASPGVSTVSPQGVGCLSLSRLAAAEKRIAASAATQVHVTDDGISARLPQGARGFAVIAAPAITGWSCSVGNGSQPGRSYMGLLSVPLDGRSTGISCAFTPPGLHLGEAVGGACLLGVVGLAGFGWWRSRRRPAGAGGSPAPAEPPVLPEEAVI
ncbi:YfhO family protein [Actinacidiphila acidipaludis]|uniref:YfhO family protein n=1 Tax=Actinacidiphila acidipaludis TaxID=2873382 RepID=A0ABS7Q0V5_9ACTN|nr:YfhO family protein [Streptomyces acidipaludis]MBY8876775.1 YfhO family protein [Streptomyces acidipaludis]